MRQLHNLHEIEVAVGETGVTVRRGTKWANVCNGEHLELCVGKPDDFKIAGKGIVDYGWQGRFRDVPARLIEMEHEISSRTYAGLLASMRRAYGDSFSEDEHVVAFSYKRVA